MFVFWKGFTVVINFGVASSFWVLINFERLFFFKRD